MVPRNRNSRFHRRMVSNRPRLGGLTLSFYSLTLFVLIAGGQVSVSHSAPIPGNHVTKDFIEREVENPTYSQFEEKLREAAAASSQEETDMTPIAVLKRMIADLAHVQNELVLTLVALALVLYFVALAWIASNQSKDKGKSKKQKLQHLGHKGIFKPYLITLVTGMLPGSGCQSEVLMKLIGTSGSTPYYNLSEMSRESGRLNPCRRAAQTAFVIWTRNIGELISVQIKLDNHHIQKNPAWLLDFIRVTDCQEETQRTWLVHRRLTGAGPHTLHIQDSRIQAVSRYMAVNLLKGFYRFSLWNAWTLLKEDTSLGAISSLCLCLLFTLSQMALSSILLYQLPNQVPTSARSDTWQQTQNLPMLHKDTFPWVLLAGGTLTITACIWMFESLLRFAPRSSSGLTKSQLRHIKKAIEGSKHLEDMLNGKFHAVKEIKAKKERDVTKITPALVPQDEKDMTSPSDEPSTSAAVRDTNEKVESSVNFSGSNEPVGCKINSGNTSEIKNTAKNTRTPNQGPAFPNLKKDASACNNLPSSSSTCTNKVEPTQNTKKNQMDEQREKVLNENVEELKNVEQMQGMKADDSKKSQDIKILKNDSTAKTRVGNDAQLGNEKELLPKENGQIGQVTQAGSSLVIQSCQTACDQQKIIAAAKDTPEDLKEIAIKENEVPPQHGGMTDMKDDKGKTEQTNDSKLDEKAGVDETKSLLKQEQDCTLSDENDAMNAGTDIATDDVTGSDTSSHGDKQATENEPVIQYVNEVQPSIRSKKRKTVISKMGKAFKGLKKNKSKSKGITVDSTSPCQSCVINMEPTVDENEANTGPSDQNPCAYEKEKTPMKKVWHKLRKISSTSLLQKEDKKACQCPSATKTIYDENKEKKSMVTQDTDDVTSKSCTETVPSGSGTDVREQGEESPVSFLKEEEPDEAVPLQSVEQLEERSIASEETQSVGQIPSKEPQLEESFTSILKQQSDQFLPCEEKQTVETSLSTDTDLPADGSTARDKQTVEAQQGSGSSAVVHVIGQKEDVSSAVLAQQAHGPAFANGQQADELPAVKDQPVEGSPDMTDSQPPIVTKPGNPSRYSGSQSRSDGTGGEKETKVVHNCDNAFFSQHALQKIQKKIVRRMLFHADKLLHEKPNVSQQSAMNQVSVALNKASVSSLAYTNILGIVNLEVQSLQENWKASCSCGLMYQIGCYVLKRTPQMKAAIGLDEVLLDKKVLGTALDVACCQEARYIVEKVIQDTKHHNTSDMKEKQTLLHSSCKLSRKIQNSQKKEPNKNKNCSAEGPATDAAKDLEMGMEEAKLNIGGTLVKKKYLDKALKIMEGELAGTTHTCIPTFLSYTIYALVVLLCIMATGVSVLLGAALNPHNAVMWLVCTVAGLACHILVLEPIKLLLIVFFSSVRRQYVI